ncbi:MAG: hypothetical protein KKG75_01090 [Nanoarchaeota archaeon]|nr:hypothetical protein [Nanoarchaeota archaeon]
MKKDISEILRENGLEPEEPVVITPDPKYEAAAWKFIRELEALYRRSRENPSFVKYSLGY